MESWHCIESELLLPSETHGLHEVRVDAVCFVGKMAPPTNINVSPSIRWPSEATYSPPGYADMEDDYGNIVPAQ
ncbi:hypothetical protein HPB48_013954 [Haemaphysalis longicornis]|uniref:Uncharacterized protein n=1 Tax=Haemaphysalis longicornis TaxID=44386 RepID=A0A9J6H658_HAELO|nr:hypothetical protein HPB48_013954 [Haemaphysalis longicornis]